MNQMWRKPDDKASTVLPPGEGPAEHTIRGRREWDDRMGVFVNRHRTQTLITLTSLGIAAFAVFGYFQKSERYEPPLVIRQDSLGQFTAVARSSFEAPPDDIAVAADLNAWVRNVRTISLATSAMRAAIMNAYKPLYPGGAAYNELNRFYTATPKSDPFTRAASEIVEVSDQTTLPTWADENDNPWRQGRFGESRAYNSEWRETTLNRDGTLKSEKSWRGEIVVIWQPPRSKDEAVKAPDGIWIRSFTMTEK